MRNKAVATGLMVGAAILFVIARSQKGVGAWEWLAAFAEAAMVGALADWFAVVALFRHPLGVPIPHTAIIKNKKQVIAANLAAFIRDKFLAPDILISKLRENTPAEHLAAYLKSPENAEGIAKGLSRVIADSLGFLDDDRVHTLLRAVVRNRIENFDLASSAATLFDTLRNDNRHQIVLDELLNRVAVWLATPEAQAKLATAIDDMITKDYPLLMHFIPNRDQFSKGAGEKIVKRIDDYIQAINIDQTHEFRIKFDTAVTGFVDRLKTDQELRTTIETIKREAVHNSILSDYVKNAGSDLQAWVSGDLSHPHSHVQEKIAAVVAGIGTTLRNSRELQESLDEHLEMLVRNYGETARTAIAEHISATVQMWESDEYVTEIELSIGSDLQFIRMNGTLVGGIIGLLLHAISLLLQ
jgi:uncharacterized membrane-anchored protein YjiN (DUF445 family)